MGLLGLIIMAALNVLMLQYHYELFIKPKVGFWTTFWEHFEMSGFDPYTYIVISQWRPLYVLSRHPLLAVMMWPFSELNGWLKDVTGMNCAIFIVAVLWTMLATLSWLLMYRIQRRLIGLNVWHSLLLTAFFFSFSHILITTFTCDHMSLTLPCLLLALYLGGRSVQQGRTMPLWQSLPLLFVSTGITTTNMVKIGIVDLCTRIGKSPLLSIVRHFLWYVIPLAIMLGLYMYQEQTTQDEERKNIQTTVEARIKRDSVFADYWKREEAAKAERREHQTVHLSIATNTEYHIDRLPSLVENIFGEGMILHSKFALKDANRHRPVLVRYDHWRFYAIEALIVLLFAAGIWYGRRERLLWMAMMMFIFDMLLHVGLNFASADVYIMTAHWAFAIPIAIGYMLRKLSGNQRHATILQATLLFLTLFLWVHNMTIIYKHILHVQ